MVEEKAGGGVSGSGGGGSGGGGGESSRLSTSFEKVGDRQRFTVELRPEETTIVSWKKLIKDANKVNGSSSTSVPVPDPPPTNAHPTLESRIAPGQPAETELEDAPAPHRFSAVIEKIERLYMGKNSSDEEDLNDIPDEDQYDTEDSFIDDAELDEYFQVDNSAVKHNGFFVNRGKLERINEPTSLPNPQPKKRRRKDMAKANAESDDVHLPRKHVKVGKMASGKSAPLAGKNSSDTSLFLAENNEHHEDVRSENQLITSKKKSADSKTTVDHSMILKVSNGGVFQGEAKGTEKQKTGATQSKNIGYKLKDTTGSSDASHHKYLDRNYSSQSKPQSGRVMNSVEDIDLSVRPREKNDIRGQPDSNYSGGKHSMQVAKASSMHRKDGSSVRPKGSILEKAIRELEKMVAESRPSTMEVQDADTSSQAVKRRLPPEVKQKLAKVARLAASHGKLSTELLNRLMSIVGHFMQLRTLKRNLKVMINTGLSAKQEKDDRFRQIKKEVTEMIKMRVASKEFEQQAGASDDFQEFVFEEKGVLKRKCSMDNAVEDKICDLYDLYVDGLDEDAGPQIRKLYAELAELWPNGSMDNHGIKRAICKAKERKRALYSLQKDQEKIRRKKLLLHKVEETAQVEASIVGQHQYTREKMATDSSSHGLASPNRPISNTALPTRIPSSSIIVPSLDRAKQEKVKVSSSNSLDEMRAAGGILAKKKMKRKPEELGEAHFRPAKLLHQQGEERHKSHKQASSLPHKSNLQPDALSSFEQLT